MPLVFKKLSCLKILSKKKLLFVLLASTVLVLFLPLPFLNYATAIEPATTAIIIASLIGSLVAGAVGIFAGTFSVAVLVLFIVTIALYFGEFLLVMGNKFLAWAARNPFGFSLTNPADNKIVEMGWTFLRDFTNMLFILGLAYIGLATALNIANFNTKKTFATLLIVALLINFSPIICGVIVDISNIVFNFLLQNPDYGPLVQTYKQHKAAFEAECGFKEKISGDRQCWAKFFVLGPFGFVAGLVLLLFALLVFVRYIAIWVLVIVSPLAFFAYIFEGTKKYAKMWWNQFLQWAFIVVPAGFFLYIAQQLLAKAWTGSLMNTAGADQDLFIALAPYFVVAIFLGIAVVAMKKINAAGAKAIIGMAEKMKNKTIGGAKKLGKTLGAAAGSLAAGAAAGAATGGVAGATEAREAGGSKWGVLKGGLTGGLKGVFSGTGRERGKETVADLMGRGAAHRKQKARREGHAAIRAELAEMSVEDLKKEAENANRFSGRGRATRALAIEKLIKDGEFDYQGKQAEDLIQYMQKDYKGINISALANNRFDLAPLLNPSKLKTDVNDFLTNNPNLAADIQAGTPGMTAAQAQIKAREVAKEKVMAQAIQRRFRDIQSITDAQRKQEEMRKISRAVLNERFVAALEPNDLRDFASLATSAQREKLRQVVTQRGPTLTSLVGRARQANRRGDVVERDTITQNIRDIRNNATFNP